MPYLGVASPASLTNKGLLYYEEHSIEQARTIVFLHDWPLHHQEWAYPVALFSRGYRTIAVDLPGFGRSDHSGGLISLEGMARDVGALFTVLSLSNVILVGAGMGAAVALTCATRYPRALAGLVLVGATSPRWVQGQGFEAGVQRGYVEGLLEAAETSWPDLLLTYAGALCHTAVGAPTRDWFVRMGLEASLFAAQQALIHLRDADQRDELPNVRIPTVVFHGVHDAIVPLSIAEYLEESIDGASLVRFEDSGHAVWIDEPYRFNKELTYFIEEHVLGDVVPPPDLEERPGGGERLPFKAIATRPRRGKPKLEGATGQVYE